MNSRSKLKKNKPKTREGTVLLHRGSVEKLEFGTNLILLGELSIQELRDLDAAVSVQLMERDPAYQEFLEDLNGSDYEEDL